MQIRRMLAAALLGLCALAASACTLTQDAISVPDTGDRITDAESAARFVPDLPSYISTDAVNITQALGSVAGGAGLISGNPFIAAVVGQIDSVIACYRATGSVAAKVYVQPDLANVVQGQIPGFGTLAVVNQDRLADNFLNCTLGSGPELLGAQSASVIEPCGETGQFVVNGQTFLYLLAGSQPGVCQSIRAVLPLGG